MHCFHECTMRIRGCSSLVLHTQKLEKQIGHTTSCWCIWLPLTDVVSEERQDIQPCELGRRADVFRDLVCVVGAGAGADVPQELARESDSVLGLEQAGIWGHGMGAEEGGVCDCQVHLLGSG